MTVFLHFLWPACGNPAGECSRFGCRVGVMRITLL
jgi:hypothetical protein